MKKIISLVFLSLIVSGIAMGGRLMWQLGVGYHSSHTEFPQSFTAFIDTSQAATLGLGAYGGLGINLDAKESLALGLEAGVNWDLANSSGFAYQGRAFLKFTPSDIVSLTAFGGLAGDFGEAISTQSYNVLNPVFGGRLRVSFVYFEYNMITDAAVSAMLKHEFGLGIALLR